MKTTTKEWTYEMGLAQAYRLLCDKGAQALNNPHAMTGRICGCGTCFCCAALEVYNASNSGNSLKKYRAISLANPEN